MTFGNFGQTNTLYFTAGTNHEADGLFGSLAARPDTNGGRDRR